MSDFELQLRADLQAYLLGRGEIDTRMPEAPDLEEKWPLIARSYMADGVREFSAYPTVALGWMMYVGMALAALWDKDWATYGQRPDLYADLRDKRGYDALDEYVREEILGLKGADYDALERLVGECAARTHSRLLHSGCEPGTPAAFHTFVEALHGLYVFGYAVQLKRMGYRMEKI